MELLEYTGDPSSMSRSVSASSWLKSSQVFRVHTRTPKQENSSRSCSTANFAQKQYKTNTNHACNVSLTKHAAQHCYKPRLCKNRFQENRDKNKNNHLKVYKQFNHIQKPQVNPFINPTMDRNALSRATESTDAPTPGYLYLDLSRLVASNPNAAKDTAAWLLNRLQHKNHNVKYKSLKLIGKLAAVHPPYFQKSVTVDVDGIAAVKECLQYRGPPDPLRGDEIYTKVRGAAQECLDALYKETVVGDGQQVQMQGQGQMQGYGAGAGGSYGAGGGSVGGGRMEGFGSHPDPRLSQDQGPMTFSKVTKFASEIGSAMVEMVKDPLAKKSSSAAGKSNIGSYNANANSSSNGYGQNSMSGNYGTQNSHRAGWGAPPGRSQLAAATSGKWTMASNRGPNAVQPPPSMGSWGTASTGQVPTSSQGIATGVPTEQPVVSIESNKSDGTYEKHLIGELCPASGLYATPDDAKMAEFKGIAPGLEVNHVSSPLLDLLENDSWQVKVCYILFTYCICVLQCCQILTDIINLLGQGTTRDSLPLINGRRTWRIV